MKLIILFIVLIFSINACKLKHKKVECNDQKNYTEGYGQGKMANGSGKDCESWVKSMNTNLGMKLEASDCFCDGYNDGFNGRKNKFEK